MEYRFIGRKAEMERLERIYSKPGLNTCAVYGRRQIGKSTLLLEFSKNKRTLFIQFSKKSYYENLIRMRNDISDFLGREVPETDSFSELILMIRDICREEKTLVIFDELPYILDTAPFVPSIIQRFIDLDVHGLDCMVVICGSSISMMRDAIEKVGSPLYGRFMERIRLEELGYRECAEFHPNMSDIDVLKTYMTAGGIPIYHLLMDCDTYEESIAKCFFGPTATLINEGDELISEDKYSDIYSAVVLCISDGIVQQKTICEKLHLDKSECSKRLKEMEKLGMVSRIRPMVGAPKRPIYRIQDNFLAFWYEVIRRHQTALSSIKMNDDLKTKLIENRVNTFLGIRFEMLCEQYLSGSYNITDIGKWWGSVNDTDTDIDIVATVVDDRLRTSQLMVECKFTHKKAGFETLNELMESSNHVGSCYNIQYMVISASGFDSRLEEYAETGPVALVGLDKIMGRTEPDDLDKIPYAGIEMMD